MSTSLQFEQAPFSTLAPQVVQVVGQEAISELFQFSVTLWLDGDAFKSAAEAVNQTPQEALLNRPLRLVLDQEGIGRRGIVAAVHVERVRTDDDGKETMQLVLEVVPTAWRLTLVTGSRVFTGEYVHQIVSRILLHHGVNHRWDLSLSYPKRQLCTQYQETDFEFVTRLLAEEGIFFYIESHDAFVGGEVPTYEAESSDRDTAVAVVKGIGDAAGIIGEPATDLVGQGFKLLADAIAAPAKDPEADDPIVPGTGTAGPGGPSDVWVFCDHAVYSVAAASDLYGVTGAVHLQVADRLKADAPDVVADFTPVQRTAADGVSLFDYDFRRPLLALRGQASHGSGQLVTYDHHGEYIKSDVDNEMASVHLEQHRARTAMAHGRSSCSLLAPGFSFQVEGTDKPGTRDGGYAVTRIRHEVDTRKERAEQPESSQRDALLGLADGCAQAISRALLEGKDLTEASLSQLIRSSIGHPQSRSHYQNSFECVPTEVVYRPSRPRRKIFNVVEPATVVGPKKAEIHTDGYGRLKVKFHWDMDEKWDDTRSCWVRVAQSWAGAGFGFQFFPRVGMEVLVSFVGGDPDRPVIIGSLYNATHPTPEALPDRATRSGIRTQSSPGGGGFNELSFEDKKGTERVFIHAQKDLDEVVNHAHSLNVKGPQSIVVKGAQQTSLGEHTLAVEGHQSTAVAANQSLLVGANRSARVMNHDLALIEGDAYEQVQGAHVSASRSDALTTVRGDHNLVVDGDSIIQINGRDKDTAASAISYVQGNHFMTARDRILLRAESHDDGDDPRRRVRIECGKSFIEVGHEHITLNADHLQLNGVRRVVINGYLGKVVIDDEGVHIEADPVTIQTADGARLKLAGKTSVLFAPQETKVLGQEVHLDTPPKADAEEGDDILTLLDMVDLNLWLTHHFQANTSTRQVARSRYRLVAGDVTREGMTDADGWVRDKVPRSATTAALTVWPADEGLAKRGPLKWLIHLRDELPEIHGPDKLAAARVRLRNLGYEPAVLDEPAAEGSAAGAPAKPSVVDDRTLSALRAFQRDNDLPITGDREVPDFLDVRKVYGN